MNRYAELPIRNTSDINNLRNKRISYKDISQYPLVSQSESDIYVITEFGDRFDSLAFQFYGDVTLWWIIAIANPNIVDFSSIFLPIGSQIRIPQNISPIIDSYNELNI
jgi:phage tail protein X|tara:strand:+ start:128 stop:451 length:324 start_codon:yes stop_codon:yes gene_type:complete